VNIRRLKLYCWPQFWRFSNFHKNYTILGFHQSQSFSLLKMRRLCYFASYVIFDRAWALYLFWPMMCLYAFYKKFKYCRLDRFDIFVTNGIWHAILKFQNIKPISPHVTFMLFRGCTAKLFDWLFFNHGGAEEQNVILTQSESSRTDKIFADKILENSDDAPYFKNFPSSKILSRFPKSLSFINRSIQFRENFIEDKISFPGKSLLTTSSATSLTALAVIPPIKFGFISTNFQASCCSNWNWIESVFGSIRV